LPVWKDICVVERKELPDLVHFLYHGSVHFHKTAATNVAIPTPSPAHHEQLEPDQVALFPWRQSKPNHTILDCHAAGLQIPSLCSETHELGEEIVASYLYQVHLYRWLETNDFGRFLIDNDL
jgi:hypothetical protein